MLDDDAYCDYLEKSGFSDPARTLLTDIRRSPPVLQGGSHESIVFVFAPGSPFRETHTDHAQTSLMLLLSHGLRVLLGL
jgi:hypothetical protein